MGGRLIRRERKFLEIKSDEREDINLDEVVEEIFSNIMFFIRFSRILMNVSRNSIFIEVDRDLFIKMIQNDFLFYVKFFVLVCDLQRIFQGDEIEDIIVQQFQY